jgi:hypothetical protein
MPSLRCKRVRVPGDGNCLFHALGHPRISHYVVRHYVVAYVAANWQRYEPFIDAEQRGGYLKRMGANGVWGDELTIDAFARCAKVCVRVFDNATGRLISSYGDEFLHRPRSLFFMLVYDGFHYDRLLPLD